MKQNFLFALGIVLAFANVCVAFSSDDASDEYKRKINKIFSVGSSPKLLVDNQFGEIRIVEGGVGQITFDITVTGKGKTEAKAREYAESVDVDVKGGGNAVSSKTSFSKIDCSNCGRSVDMVVTVPKDVLIQVKNAFGNVRLEVDGVDGLMADVRFGHLYAGALGKAKLEIWHGGVTIDKCGMLDLDGKHSKFNVGDVEKFKGDVAHSSMKMEKIDEVADVEMKFCTLEIGSVENAFMVSDFSQGTLKIKKINKDFKAIDIDAKFSKISLPFPQASFKATLEGDFSNIKVDRSGFSEVMLEKRTAFVGVAGSNPASSIRVSNAHGSITMQ